MRSDLSGRPADGASWASLVAEDQAAFNIDPRSVDWPTYVSTIHLPSIVHHSRAKTKPGQEPIDRTDRLRRSVLSPERHLAAFDLENTLDRQQRGRELLVARHPAAEHARAGALRGAHARRGAHASAASTARTAATSCASSTVATRTRPSSQIDEDSKELLAQPHPHQELPRRPPPGARAPRTRSSHDPHHRRARLRRRRTAPAVRRDRRRRDERSSPMARTAATLSVVPPTGETRAQILADYCAAEGLKLEESDRLRRLDQRPADARGGRLPGRGQPRDPPRRDRPQARLAGRALVEGIGCPDQAAAARATCSANASAGARSKVAMSRLVFSRKPARFAAARLAGTLMPGRGASVGPLSLEPDEPLPLPGPDWVRAPASPRRHLRQRSGRWSTEQPPPTSTRSSASRSPPATKWSADVEQRRQTGRVVLVPVLSCITRGISPVCHACAAGAHPPLRTGGIRSSRTGSAERLLRLDTGGGWSHEMVAHPSQLVPMPDDLSDEAAVLDRAHRLRRPCRCPLHGQETVIIGAGNAGPARRWLPSPPPATANAPAPSWSPPATPSRSGWPRSSAPTSCAAPTKCPAGCARPPESLVFGDQLTCGVPHVIDCVGSQPSRCNRRCSVGGPGWRSAAGGNARQRVARTHLAVAPGDRDPRLLRLHRGPTSTSPIDVVRRFDLGRLVSATYPLDGLQRRHRPRRIGRSPWRGEDRLRSAS